MKKQRDRKRKAIDRNQAFIEFKGLPQGKELEDQIIQHRNELKDKKLRIKQLTDQCNQTKRELDQVKLKLDEKAQEKKKQLPDELMPDDDQDNQVQEIIDEEELAYLQRMKELKKSYRENYQGLKEVKGEVFFIQQSIDQLKQQLVQEFEDWFVATFDEEGAEYTQSATQIDTLKDVSNTVIIHPFQYNKTTKTIGSARKADVFKDYGVDDDNRAGEGADGQQEIEGKDMDKDVLAFIKAKRKVDELHKAKKHERKI